MIILSLFILGTIFGSFILAVTDRMKTGADWVNGRSECEYCKHVLQPKDLVPILSWLFTRGKCRYCGRKLSVIYPLAEIGLGLLFSISYSLWPYVLQSNLEIVKFIIWLIALVLMWGLLLYDARWYKLPNKLVYPLQIAGLAWAAVDLLETGVSIQAVLSYVLAIIVSAGFFFILFYISEGKWIGYGDVRLGVAIGLFSGTWQLAWMCILGASLLGLLLYLPSMFKKGSSRAALKARVPFGPLLIIGLIFSVLVGQSLLDWYINNLLLI